jgi:hypothetical protein
MKLKEINFQMLLTHSLLVFVVFGSLNGFSLDFYANFLFRFLFQLIILSHLKYQLTYPLKVLFCCPTNI